MHEVMSRRQRLPDPSGEGWLVRSSVTNSSGVPGLLTVLVPVGPVWPEPAVWFSGFSQHYLLLSSLGPHLPRLPFTQAPVQAVSPCAPPSVNSPPRFRPGSQYPPCLSPGSFPDLFVLVTQPRALPTVLGWAILPFSSPASSPPLPPPPPPPPGLLCPPTLPPTSPSHPVMCSFSPPTWVSSQQSPMVQALPSPSQPTVRCLPPLLLRPPLTKVKSA